ncbi:MAG: malonyl-CoA decarboxylase family protein [Pseudomonadota bacterium]
MVGKQKNNKKVNMDKAPVKVSERNNLQTLVKLMQEILDNQADDLGSLEKIRTGYTKLTREDRAPFFSLLQETIELEPGAIASLAADLTRDQNDPAKWRQALVKLRSGAESPRQRLFRYFIRVPWGLKFLLDLRADLLAAQSRGGPDLGPLDSDLVHLFESWFQDGFLFLSEITLDSPYRQIEIIKNGDMVHPMSGLEEMGRRLGRDRRCFALYHCAMPQEPVVFIEVALTYGVARSIHEIIGPLNRSTEARPDTAVFYSINNTQNGLAGLGLGKVLIFQVVDFLERENENIRNFCTLSPVPGFWRRYLQPLIEGRAENFKMKLEDLEKLFDKRTRSLLEKQHQKQGGQKDDAFADMLLKVFSSTDWSDDKQLATNLAKPIKTLGYFYLAEEKDRAGRPLDPVANFHLSNGATLSAANVNFGANWTTMGLERSLSLMVNYIYSQRWTRQISESMAWLGGLLPGLSRSWTGKWRMENAKEG